MAAALLTGIFASVAGIVAAIYLGLTWTSNGTLGQHISIGIFSTMITLFTHSMMMFYFLGKGKAVREAAAEGGLSREYERRIAIARKPVFSIATLAMVATIVTALVGRERRYWCPPVVACTVCWRIRASRSISAHSASRSMPSPKAAASSKK